MFNDDKVFDDEVLRIVLHALIENHRYQLAEDVARKYRLDRPLLLSVAQGNVRAALEAYRAICGAGNIETASWIFEYPIC